MRLTSYRFTRLHHVWGVTVPPYKTLSTQAVNSIHEPPTSTHKHFHEKIEQVLRAPKRKKR